MIEFSKHSGIYTLKAKQFLKLHPSEAWHFFSNPTNLPKITPPSMGFQITSEAEDRIYPGQIITYKVAIVPGLKSNWVTEITQVREGEFFIDEQRFGPYSMWHHEHHFQPMDDGVLMTDKISYKLPFSPFSSILHPVFIKPQLSKIFNYRKENLAKMFEVDPQPMVV